MNKYMRMTIQELEELEQDFRERLSAEQLHTDADRLDRAAAISSINKVRGAIQSMRNRTPSYSIPLALY